MGRHYFQAWERSHRFAPKNQLQCTGHTEGFRKYNLKDLALDMGVAEETLKLCLHRIMHLKVCCEYEDNDVLSRLAG